MCSLQQLYCTAYILYVSTIATVSTIECVLSNKCIVNVATACKQWTRRDRRWRNVTYSGVRVSSPDCAKWNWPITAPEVGEASVYSIYNMQLVCRKVWLPLRKLQAFCCGFNLSLLYLLLLFIIYILLCTLYSCVCYVYNYPYTYV